VLYFEIALQVIAILIGISEIYNKFILKKEYKQDSFILLALAIFYSKDSQSNIVQCLLFVVAVIILIILFDKLFSKIRRKC
jgi:hypothetical protein